MGRIHAHEGRAELLGEPHPILALEKPGKHWFEFATNALAALTGSDGLEVPRHPDRDQDDDHRWPEGQDPHRQSEWSDDDEQRRS